MTNANGMVLHLYKHLDKSLCDIETLGKITEKERTYIAFGNFDRLCFSPVERFSDYLSESSGAYRWIGAHKDIILYPLEANKDNRHFVFGDEKGEYNQPPLVILEENQQICNRQFLLITMLYVAGDTKAAFPIYEDFLSNIQAAINNIALQYNKTLKAINKNALIHEVFGTFNSSEVAVIWAADQFAEVQFLIDQLRYLSFDFCGTIAPVFTSTYTIVALANSRHVSPQNIERVLGGAMIQLAASTKPIIQYPKETNTFSYLQSIKEKLHATSDVSVDIDFCAGEYDYIFQCRPPQIQLLCKDSNAKYGVFHIGHELYHNYFSSSTTRLYYDLEKDIHIDIRNKNWSEYLTHRVSEETLSNPDKIFTKKKREVIGALKKGDYENNIRHKFESFKKSIREELKYASSFDCNLDLLFSDYVQCVNTTPDVQWAKDLSLQFNVALDLLDVLKEEIGLNDIYINFSKSIFDILQQQIRHVADAGKFFFEEPSLHSESTSQYDLLFHMYYGVVKEILSNIYDRTHGNFYSQQSKLIPLIRFRPTPIVKSVLYFDIPKVQNRILDISLPYDAWGEPCHCIPLLVHELYHYNAPPDRYTRNEIYAKIILTELLTTAAQYQLNDAYINDEKLRLEISEVEFERAAIKITQIIRHSFAATISSFNIGKALKLICGKSEEYANLDVAWQDMNWAEYVNYLQSWFGGEFQYIDEPGNFGSLVVKATKNVITEILDKRPTNQFSENENKLTDIIVASFSTIDTGAEGTIKTFVEWIQEANEDWGHAVINELREMLPDYAMTQLTGMTVTDYMLIFATLQEKLFNSADTLSKMDSAIALRIGFILNHLLVGENDTAKAKVATFAGLRKEFCDIYTAYIWNCSNTAKNEESKKDVEMYADKWFDFFEAKLRNYYAIYSCYQGWFDLLAKTQFEPLCSQNNCKRIKEKLGQYFGSLKNGTTIFKKNMLSVWAFQSQEFLEDIQIKRVDTSDQTKKLSLGKMKNVNGIEDKDRKRTRHFVESVKELNAPISSVTNSLSEAHSRAFGESLPMGGLWYRGSKNANYKIMPSIMVHFFDEENTKTQNGRTLNRGENLTGTILDYQKKLLERFKYRADGAPEFINGTIYTSADYLALMQHYGHHTLFLDWSEDAFTSLYFSLQDYIGKKSESNMKTEGEIEKNEKKNVDAALYVLDPMLYNRARRKMITKQFHVCSTQPCLDTNCLMAQNRFCFDEAEGYIPNISVEYNKTRCRIFAFDIPKECNNCVNLAYLESSKPVDQITLSDFERQLLNLPLAIYTSKLNPRIRAQSGQFIAFSPFTLPAYGTKTTESAKGSFDYISLLEIQRYYLEEFPDEDPFMHEIIIKRTVKNDLGIYLSNSGINKYRIYPELENLKENK